MGDKSYHSCRVLCLALLFIPLVGAHGWLNDPPSRGSLGRAGFPNEPINYDVHGQNCGGIERQWVVNGGKCGVCGDPFDAYPRPHEEPDGIYATGTIVKRYIQGGQLPVEVVITWGHRGWMEFRLCPVDDMKLPVTSECLDRILLPASGSRETRFQVEAFGQRDTIDMILDLPRDLTCSHCVLQWKYHTGKDWGCESGAGCCVGCGPQEEFYGCADIAIDPVTGPITTTTRRTTLKTTSRGTTRATLPTRLTTTKPTTPRTTTTPTTQRKTTSSSPTTRKTVTYTRNTTPPKSTQSVWSKAVKACKGLDENNKSLAYWCRANCLRQYCPVQFCNADCQKLTTWK